MALIYEDKESKEYIRAFATTTLINPNGFDGLVIDFCEEYIKPLIVVMQQNDFEKKYSHNPDDLIVIREKKCSVTLNKDTALKLADWIKEHYGINKE
jgi:hypothetical protein